MRARAVHPRTAAFTFALAQVGGARVLVDGNVVLDGIASPPPPGGTEFFGFASQELTAEVPVQSGVPLEVVLELVPAGSGSPGARVGFRAPEPPDLLDRAVAAAASADVAIVVVGTTREWESEGHDRAGFALPEDLPIDYYARIVQGTTLPVLVVEGGWPSIRVGSTVSTPAVQARYIARQVQLLGQTSARALFQLTFYDLDLTGLTLPPGSVLPLFTHLGLADSAMNAKPALSAWDSVFARPYRP